MNRKIRILIVEHNPDDIELLLEELKLGKINFISEIVRDRNSYCNAITSLRPDIILSDYSHATFTGDDAFALREELTPSTPFLFVSGSMGEEKSIEYIRNGVTDYIQKDKLFSVSLKVKRALEEAKTKQEIKVSQQQLIQTADLLERAQQLAHMGSWEFNFKKNKFILSAGASIILGFPKSQNILSYTKWTRLVHPDDLDRILETFQHSRLTLKDSSYNHRIKLKDGSIRDLYSESKFEFSENSEITGMYGIIQDVTERNKNESALRIAYDDKITILERIDDGFFAIDTNSSIIYWNKSAELLLGIRKENVIGKKVQDVFAGTENQVYLEHCQEALLKKETVHFRQFSMSSGRWFEVNAYASDKGLSVYFKDVTENKIAADKLKESELRYRSLNEQATDAICITDSAMRFIDINAYACEIFGYTQEEALQLSVYDILFFEDLALNPLRFSELQPGKSVRNERRLKRKNGTAIYMEVSTKVMEDGRMIIYGHDITERKRVEQEMGWLINNTEESFILINRSLEITSFNLRARNLYLNYFGKDLTKGDCILDYAQSQRRDVVKEIYSRVLIGYEVVDEIVMDVPDGGKRIFAIRYKPAKDEYDMIIGVFVSAIDITEKKEAEIQKEFERRDKEALINTTTDFMWSVTKDFKLIAANRAFTESMARYNDIQIEPGDDVLKPEKFPVDNLLFWKKLYTKALLGEHHSEEIHLPAKKDQAASWKEITFNPIYDGHSITGVACYARDNTLSKDFQIRLIEINKKLQTAQDIAGLGYWNLDIENQVLYWSDHVYTIWGVTPATFELSFSNYLASIHEADRPLFDLAHKNAMDGIDKLDIEYRITLPSGKIKFVHDKGELVQNPEDKFFRFEGTVQDITERKELELLLFKANALARIGSWEYDPLAETLYWSAITKEIHEVDQFFVPDMQSAINFYKSGENREQITSVMTQAVQRGIPFDTELQIITAKNNEKWIRAIGESEFENAVCKKVTGSFQDITERKVSEVHLQKLNENIRRHAKELAVSNAELEQFAYVASHDLQEPLRMITSFLSQLEKKYASLLDEKGKKYIDFAVGGAKRMRHIILDLLDYSRVGRSDETMALLDLNELVGQLRILFHNQIEEKNATIVVAKLPRISGHRSPVHQVFQNLVGNALKYAAADRSCEITINATESEDEWLFSVEDNGIGISAEYYDKIFIIFQRLHSNEDYSGTGMGLAITKKIIENLGGKIWVQSTEGKGSTFFFTLKK